MNFYVSPLTEEEKVRIRERNKNVNVIKTLSILSLWIFPLGIISIILSNKHAKEGKEYYNLLKGWYCLSCITLSYSLDIIASIFISIAICPIGQSSILMFLFVFWLVFLPTVLIIKFKKDYKPTKEDIQRERIQEITQNRIMENKIITIADNIIYFDSQAFFAWASKQASYGQYEKTAFIALNEQEPTISFYEDGEKTVEYRLETEGNEDFTGKYFLISVRIGLMGNPPAPTMQMDGFISDTNEDRKMELSDIGYRMEGHYLKCGGEVSENRYNMMRGQDLVAKGLKYPGYTTPSDIRLIGICPECGKSFAFHGYAFYMAQNDVAYSDDGLDCCQIQEYEIDKETWKYETEGKVFRYYNSFNCPNCGVPYIDYKNNKGMKEFGVSGCVLLGRKSY